MSRTSLDNDRMDEHQLAKIQTHHKHLGTVNAAVQHDGRFNIKFNEKALRFARKLEKRSYVRRQLYADLQPEKSKKRATQPAIAESHSIPRLNVAVHIVGSRGDVQPFIAIGKVLAKPPYNHRIRICTHPVFKDFVEENGLEFFSIGGDPAVLMAYMVKNPGLMPGMESLRAGDVGKRRADIAEILEGCWRSCVEAGDGMGGESKPKGAPPLTDPVDRLFVADAIIANPPSYAHIHCAEKLGVPLHMMFTYVHTSPC
jgi:sterol 3beta-glucosyltransferase